MSLSLASAAIAQSQVRSPCQDACPIHLSCHGLAALVSEGKAEEAYRLVMQRLPFPRTLGRVCNHPCESKCRRTQLDSAVNLMALKRFVAEQIDKMGGSEYRPQVKAERRERVAIIGSGPCGLSAAYDLAQEGFQVTVFEAMGVPGGMLAVGAPEFRLPREVLASDIENVTALGVKLELGQHVSEPGLLLSKGFQAVLIATGAHKGVKLPVAGVDRPGVWVATSFLREVSLGMKPRIGHTVMVIGGGDVALDAARTAVRLGAQKVGMACLETLEGMPADALEVKRAEEEGIDIHPSRTLAGVVHSTEGVSGIECLKVRSVSLDSSGRLQIDRVEGSEHILPAETVIFAVGQNPDLEFLGKNNRIVTKGGMISVDRQTLATNIEGVFAGGDVAIRTGSVAKAVADGQRAALSITMFLDGREPSQYAVRADGEIVPLPSEPPTVETLLGMQRSEPPELAAGLRNRCWDEAVSTLTAEQAFSESSRCLRCDLDRSADIMDPRRVGFAETTQGQIDRIWENGKGNYGHFLRKTLLHGLGIRRKLDRADTVIIFGCAMPFGMPRQVLSSLRILDSLGVEYTFLKDKEYCCAVPVIEMSKDGNEGTAKAASATFVKTNLDAALGLGAKRVAYLCQWCVYAVTKYVPEEQSPQIYFYDLLLQPDVLGKLKQRQLKVPRTRVGYFEGCHLRNLAYAPGVEINWRRYRSLLEMVDGVEIEDIPALKCCVVDAENIVENARRRELDAIVSPCAACWTWIERAGSRKDFPVKMLRDVLAEALTGRPSGL